MGKLFTLAVSSSLLGISFALLLLNTPPRRGVVEAFTHPSQNRELVARYFGVSYAGSVMRKRVGVQEAHEPFDPHRYVFEMLHGVDVCLRWREDDRLVIEYPASAYVARQQRSVRFGDRDVEIGYWGFGRGPYLSLCLGQRGSLDEERPPPVARRLRVPGGIDCDDDGSVTEDDVAAALRVAQGIEPLERCTELDRDRDGKLQIEEIPLAAPNETMYENWRAALGNWWGTVPGWMTVDGAFRPETEISSRNQGITSRYAQLYFLNRDYFKWAGCAAFISDQVGLGLGLHELLRTVIELRDLETLRRINTAVYHDLAWAHLAFRQGGLPKVERGVEGVAGQDLLLKGFQELERGRELIRRGAAFVDESREAIWNGNVLLLKHEQKGLIQEQIEHLGDLAAKLISWAVVIDFDADNWGRDKRTRTRFSDVMMREHGRYGDIRNFDDRWSWIEKEILPQWKIAMQSDEFDGRLRRLIERPLRPLEGEPKTTAAGRRENQSN